MEKTIKEWLEMLPEEFEGKPLRKMALENHTLYPMPIPTKTFENIAYAIGAAFDWGMSVQGYYYWRVIYFLLCNGEIKLSEPQPVATQEIEDELNVNGMASNATYADMAFSYQQTKEKRNLSNRIKASKVLSVDGAVKDRGVLFNILENQVAIMGALEKLLK